MQERDYLLLDFRCFKHRAIVARTPDGNKYIADSDLVQSRMQPLALRIRHQIIPVSV